MLDVDVEKILPITEVRDSLNKIIDAVTDSEDLYVITKNGKPAAIIVGVHHLEKLTGIDHKMIIPEDVEDDVKNDDPIVNKDSNPLDVSTSSSSVTTDTSNTTISDTSTNDTTLLTPHADIETSTNNATMPETPIVTTIQPPQEDLSVPEIKTSPIVDDGLDDLFAPETPIAEQTIAPSFSPTPAMSPAPVIDTNPLAPTTGVEPTVVTPPAQIDSQPVPSITTTNPPVNPAAPVQSPIPPTTTQL